MNKRMYANCSYSYNVKSMVHQQTGTEISLWSKVCKKLSFKSCCVTYHINAFIVRLLQKNNTNTLPKSRDRTHSSSESDRGPIWVNLDQTGSAGVDTSGLMVTCLNGIICCPSFMCNKFSSCFT